VILEGFARLFFWSSSALSQKIKSSIPTHRELRFYFYSGVEYDQNPKFIKAFFQ
jgi:hypothetical protein